MTAEPVIAAPLGLARLSKLAFDGADLKPLRQELRARCGGSGPEAAAALMDLALIEQLLGHQAAGLQCQRDALRLSRIYRSPRAVGTPSARVLALAAPGDVGTNAPLEFLLEGTDVALDTLYVAPGEPAPALPAFDVALVAVGESTANLPVLRAIADLTAGWRAPILNHPSRIARLSRDGVATMFRDAPGLHAPQARRLDRDALQRETAFPFIARPVDSHAGRGLARIGDPAALDAYLAARSEPHFFVATFIDYRSTDGLFRKYRIAFIGGEPFACHLAISHDWMIYYLNAGMRESAAKRAEEARFMAEFDESFARRHRAALRTVAARIGLDYFAIDCGEMPDGRLLLFEADVAMIVHAMDPPDLFPYKAPQMRKLFDAFAAMLKRAGTAAKADHFRSLTG